MLADGKYTLRASPAGGVGGMYATGHNEVNAQVTTSAQIPHTIGRQVWEIKVVNAAKGIYNISLWTSGSTFGGVFAAKHRIGNPEGPIITSQDVQEWHISPVKTGIEGTYRIALVRGEIIGVEYIVGTEGTKVVLKSFPILLQEEGAIVEGLPYWKLHKID